MKSVQVLSSDTLTSPDTWRDDLAALTREMQDTAHELGMRGRVINVSHAFLTMPDGWHLLTVVIVLEGR